MRPTCARPLPPTQLKDAEKVASYTPGQKLEVAEMFKEGDNVDVAGTTIGKGFQGAQARGKGKGGRGEGGLGFWRGCRQVQ
jgi:large subunit ribosomal protein L3